MVTIISLSLQILVIPYIVNIKILASYQFYKLGAKALVPAFIYAFIQTSLSEEIFFRGFLTKRLINKYGFQAGNAFQSLLFGLIHGLMLKSSLLGALVIIMSTGIAAWLMGWINEREANGSILLSWLLYGYLNYASSIFMMFNLY
ncbi:MAG TPA: CPBP family intramembrane metalloprotease [Clostridiaceae bacterium]|nr:CPBP family intramembrane metalloprotease [Clostridiaceae bacterium]